MTNTDRLAQALLPCPFCGSTELKFVGAHRPYWFVRCKCGAQDGLCHTKDQAYESWNTRAALASLAPAAVEGDDISWRVKWLRQARINNADETDNKWLLELADRVAALTAQCEGLRKDAERYRVVKESDEISVRVKKYIPDGTFHWQEIGFCELDAAIDSASR